MFKINFMTACNKIIYVKLFFPHLENLLFLSKQSVEIVSGFSLKPTAKSYIFSGAG